jgi:hypothetical protein
MTDQEVIAKLREKAADEKIACKVALELAETLGVTPRRVGDLATQEKIRIMSCQLGCFK